MANMDWETIIANKLNFTLPQYSWTVSIEQEKQEKPNLYMDDRYVYCVNLYGKCRSTWDYIPTISFRCQTPIVDIDIFMTGFRAGIQSNNLQG